jgi:hypothetical protein
MFLRKINIKNFSFCKKDFFDALNSLYLAIRSCRNYAISNKTYYINDNFKKCIECMQSNCNCNLTILFTSIKRIYKKRLRLKKEVRKMRIKLSYLKRQLNFLENKKKEIIVIK